MNYFVFSLDFSTVPRWMDGSSPVRWRVWPIQEDCEIHTTHYFSWWSGGGCMWECHRACTIWCDRKWRCERIITLNGCGMWFRKLPHFILFSPRICCKLYNYKTSFRTYYLSCVVFTLLLSTVVKKKIYVCLGGCLKHVHNIVNRCSVVVVSEQIQTWRLWLV